jgi:hypothetical protein
MWVATQDLPRSAAHPFYTRLNQILETADFDGYVEALCRRFYADEIGRPGLPRDGAFYGRGLRRVRPTDPTRNIGRGGGEFTRSVSRSFPLAAWCQDFSFIARHRFGGFCCFSRAA